MNYVNKSVMGCIVVALGSLSVGLQTGVIMAGKADARGTTQLQGLHLVGSGVWGGFVSVLAGILGMMADKRTKMPFMVPKFYYPYFAALSITSFLGFLISAITLGINGATIGNVTNDCATTRINSGLYLYVDLFCYGIVAAAILVPVSACLLILHGFFCYLCFQTIRFVHWRSPLAGHDRLDAGSTASHTPAHSISSVFEEGEPPHFQASHVSEQQPETGDEVIRSVPEADFPAINSTETSSSGWKSASTKRIEFEV